MSMQTWVALVVLSFIISPALGLAASCMYLFNYLTALIFELYKNNKQRGFK